VKLRTEGLSLTNILCELAAWAASGLENSGLPASGWSVGVALMPGGRFLCGVAALVRGAGVAGAGTAAEGGGVLGSPVFPALPLAWFAPWLPPCL